MSRGTSTAATGDRHPHGPPGETQSSTGGLSAIPGGLTPLGSIQGILNQGPEDQLTALREWQDRSVRLATMARAVGARRAEIIADCRELRAYLRETPDPRSLALDGPVIETRASEWDRIEACVRGAYPRRYLCGGCSRVHVVLEGSCKSRICPICRERYGRSRASEYRDRLGPADWLGCLVVTMPPEVCQGIGPGVETALARGVERTFLNWCQPYVPAGVLVVHWAGDREPRKMHLHWNVLLSNRAYDPGTGELVRLRGQYQELWVIRQAVAAVSAGMGVSYHRSQGRWGYQATHAGQRHMLRYVLRSQGCGDHLARAMWTIPRARHNRPLGMLARGRLGEWRQLNPWRDPAQRAAALGDLEDGQEGSGDQTATICPSCGNTTREQ